MRATARLDGVVAAGFTGAATAEAVLRFDDDPMLLALNVLGALTLATLAVRRTRPVLALVSIGLAAVVVALVTHAAQPGVQVEATVAVVAMMVATYSVGAHAQGRAALAVAVGVPLCVVLATDLTTLRGWSLVSGVVFVSVFVGAVPALVGRLVRTRSRTVEQLRVRRGAIVAEQAAQREAAVLAERVALAERLQPALVDGLRELADDASRDAPPGEIEERARLLLARTRREVVALIADVDPAPATPPSPYPVDRAVARPRLVLWTLASTWALVAVLGQTLGSLGGSLVEAGLALGTAFGVGVLLRWPGTVFGLMICVAGHAVATGPGDLPGTTAAMVAAWLAGLVLNDLGCLARELRATNGALSGREDALAARAVIQERLRIARDLHDVLGHTLTVVALQAGAARRVSASDPARAREVVRTLAQVAHDGVTALEEDRPVLDLADLVSRTRAAGIEVTAELGDELYLSDSDRVVVYRLVQESLTNVLCHAPGAQVHLTVRRHEPHLEVEVANTAPTGSPERRGSGQGLVGIRERVTAARGVVHWGPRADGGFAVVARLPLAMELT
jgi:signal transduction histidine kinase